VEYLNKAIAGKCGEGLIESETEQFANALLPMCKSMNDFLEKAEDAVLNGTGIIETEESDDMTGIKSNTDPLKGSQPKEEMTALEAFTKSLLKK
jgi:phage FluMu protein Com